GRLSGAKILALAVALTGVFGVVLQGAEGGIGFSGAALLWGLLSGLSYASFYLFGKIFLSRLDPITLLAWAFSVASLALLPFVPFSPKSQVAWTALASLGFFSTYLAYFVYYLGLRRIEPTRASVIASIEPVVATFLAWWLWNERLSALGYFWAAWVVGGIALMVRAK
ncbi:MAG TPA: DMT family transporter, partial [Bdellovibrionota bacterium]|nr:DMT family transporter [Bdellovibrionota bacterium]